MAQKESFTNEKLLKKFKSQFDLVNYAIRLAENMIHSGRDARVQTDGQNRALQIIAEIEQDKDRFVEIRRAEVAGNSFSGNGEKNEERSDSRKRIKDNDR